MRAGILTDFMPINMLIISNNLSGLINYTNPGPVHASDCPIGSDKNMEIIVLRTSQLFSR
jgi:hypothetical protein